MNLSKRVLVGVVSLVGSFVLVTQDAHAVMFAGSLSAAGGGLVGTEEWNSSSTTFSWEVDFINNLWHYDYHFSAPAKNVSHILIEVSNGSDPFTDQNVFPGTSAHEGPQLFGPQGNSNPNIPEPVYSLKFNGTSTNENFSIVTDRAPVWGDVYGKDGKNSSSKNDVIFYNAGFTSSDTDPANPPSNGSVQFHALVPDTKTTTPPSNVIPEPSSLLLLGLGFWGAGFSPLKGRKKFIA